MPDFARPCSVPKCGTASLFEMVGMVDGRFESRCRGHAEADAERKLADALERLDAIRSIEVPGQMRLVS